MSALGSIVKLTGIAIGCAGLFLAYLAYEDPSGPIHRAIARTAIGYPPQRALEAFANSQWAEALDQARHCSDKLGGVGLKVERLMEVHNETIPPIGPAGQRETNDVMRQGNLNSLANCSLIAGEAAEKMHDVQHARKWFDSTRLLSYARIYHRATKTFWSPAERAGEALKRLN